MNRKQSQTEFQGFNRRRFCAATGYAALATMVGSAAKAEEPAQAKGSANVAPRTGNGDWTYDVVPGWGNLPPGSSFGGTHGAIATDNAGNVYVSTQSEMGILVYGPDGVLKKTIVNQYPEVHSIFHAQEDGVEYFYTTVQKGTPQENWLFVKMKTDGTVVQEDYCSGGGRLQSSERMADHGGGAGAGWEHLHR